MGELNHLMCFDDLTSDEMFARILREIDPPNMNGVTVTGSPISFLAKKRLKRRLRLRLMKKVDLKRIKKLR